MFRKYWKSSDRLPEKAGYPRIFRPTRGERVLKAAMELDALEPDVLEAIDQMLDSYLQEIVVANDSMLRTTRRWEAQEQLDGQGPTEQATEWLRQAHRDLDVAMVGGMSAGWEGRLGTLTQATITTSPRPSSSDL